MNLKKIKIRKEQKEFHEDDDTLKMALISKKEIVISFGQTLYFLINLKESNKIEFEHYIYDMIFLPDKTIALSFELNITILKKSNNQKYEIHKNIDIKSIYLLNLGNILYSFDTNTLNLINLNNYSIISSITFNKNLIIENKPFFLNENNKFSICVRKDYNLFLLDSKTYKEKNKLSFNEYIDFTVTQKKNEKNKFYVCINKDWVKKENKINIEIREYNSKFNIIKKYDKILYTHPVIESLYPMHLCIQELLAIKNKFYIFMHSFAELQRNNYQDRYILDFESNRIKSLYSDCENYTKNLAYKFILDKNNQLIFAYFYGDQNESDENEMKGIKIVNYEEMDSEPSEGSEDYEYDDDVNENNESEYDDKGNEIQDGGEDEDSEENVCEDEESEEDKKEKNKIKTKSRIGKKNLGKKTKRKKY